MVEAQGCPCLVAKAGEKWPVGQNPWRNYRWGPSPNEANIRGKGLGGKAQGVKWYWFGAGVVGITSWCPKGGLAPWVGKPLGGSQDPSEVWTIQPENEGCRNVQNSEGQRDNATPTPSASPKAKHVIQGSPEGVKAYRDQWRSNPTWS
jgi:hypothetical protein